MAFNFKDGFNKFAEYGNKLNKSANNIIGKDVFNEIKTIEEPKTFPSLDAFPEYTIPEPEQFEFIKGEKRTFSISDSSVVFSGELDSCFKLRKEISNCAEYYAQRFKFKYCNCVKDFDTFAYYFEDLYLEGLKAMRERTYGLLLPFGIFNITKDNFLSAHIERYHKAYESYAMLTGVEKAKNEQARNSGNALGGAIQMQGGGFGMKGAMKGMAQAEAFNLGLGLLGKLAEHQMRMTQEDKAEVFSKFKHDVLFDEVFYDYNQMLLTVVALLSDNGIISGVKVTKDEAFETTITNLNNPMFPQDRFAQAIASLIQSYPFEKDSYDLLMSKFSDESDAKQLYDYYMNL